MELTLCKVSEVYFDMKLVTGHLFKCWGALAHQKIALPQVAAAAAAARGKNVRGRERMEAVSVIHLF